MGTALRDLLTPERSLIFRITHISNLPWTLTHGTHCSNTEIRDPGFRSIGNPDLISKRARRPVPIAPGGMLCDYVPFYFTPRTPMMLNIKTGRNGVEERPLSQIAILVASLRKIAESGLRFVYTDSHAYSPAAQYSSDLGDLESLINWRLLQSSDFRRNPENPLSFDQYQAEALIHQCLPAANLLAVAVNSQASSDQLADVVKQSELDPKFKLLVKPDWYV